MRRFAYLVPEDAAAAGELLARPHTLAKAGGVDLLDRMKEGLERPATVVGLHRVLEDGVAEGGGTVRIGAGITLARLAEAVAERFPALAMAAGQTATPQVREMATLGGNLLQRPRCWYFRSRHYPCLKKGGDTCFAQVGRHEEHALFENDTCAVVHPSSCAPALVALGARLEVRGAEGAVREVPLDRFYTPAWEDPAVENVLQPGDLVQAVLVPAASAGPRSAHYEVRQKQSFDWPLAMAAVCLEGPRPRLVVGAVASLPLPVDAAAPLAAWRDRQDRDALDAAARTVTSAATPLPGNAWRLSLLRAAVRRAMLLAAGIPEEQW